MYIHTQIYTYTHAIYIYIYIHTHIYIYTYIHIICITSQAGACQTALTTDRVSCSSAPLTHPLRAPHPTVMMVIRRHTTNRSQHCSYMPYGEIHPLQTRICSGSNPLRSRFLVCELTVGPSQRTSALRKKPNIIVR